MKYILTIALLLISFKAGAASSAGSSSATKTKIAFLAGFSSGSSSIALTDMNLEKGLRVFLKANPEADKALDFIKFDNQGEANNTAFEMKKIAEQKIRFVIGVSKTNHALVAAPLADQGRILFITPQATNDKITRNHPYVFRTCFSDSYQGKGLAVFAVEKLKAKHILVLTNVDTPYSVGLSQHFIQVVNKRAGITEYRYVPEDLRLEALHKEIERSKPDLIFIPDYVDVAVGLIKEIFKTNPQVTLLGGDGWGGREVLDSAVSPLVGIKGFYASPWNDKIKTPENEQFVSLFSTMFPGEVFSSGAASMFDALHVFWEAYKATPAPRTPESIQKTLLSKTFSTTTGPISFPDPKDHTPSKQIIIIRLNAGKNELYWTY